MPHQLAIDRMSFGERLAFAFRERQIYVRSEGQVRFITLRPWLQISFVLIIFGIFGWIAYASLTVAFKDYVIAAKKRQFATVQTGYEDRITQMLSSMDQLNGRLLLNQDTVEAQLDNVRDVQNALELRQRQIAALMAKQFGISISDLMPEEDTGPRLVSTDTRTRLLIGFEPAQSDIRYSRIPGRQSSLGQSDAESVDALRRFGRRMRDLATAQKTALELMESRANERAETLETAIASLGFEPDRFVPRPGAGDAVGGPLIQLGSFDPEGPATAEDRQIMRISTTTDTINAYVDMLRALPVRYPLPVAVHPTSGFGPRRDPFTGVSAMHQGIDYPRPTGSPVTASAAGTVKRAGWAGAYGRMIEIRHDNGVSTRYAHLSKIEVSVGQHVEPGDEIGLVGTTGRSTGSHLHFETRVNGKAVNPIKFLKAGSYVL